MWAAYSTTVHASDHSQRLLALLLPTSINPQSSIAAASRVLGAIASVRSSRAVQGRVLARRCSLPSGHYRFAPAPLVPAQPTAGLQLALHSVPPFLLDGPAPDKPTGLSVTIEEPPHRGHGGPPDAPAHPRPLQSVCLSTACSIKFSAIRDSWLKRYVGPTSPPPSPPTDTVTEGDVCAVPWCARSVCVDADSGRVHRTCGLTHAAELKRKTRAGSLTLGRIRARWLHEGWSTQRLRAGPRVLQPAAC